MDILLDVQFEYGDRSTNLGWRSPRSSELSAWDRFLNWRLQRWKYNIYRTASPDSMADAASYLIRNHNPRSQSPVKLEYRFTTASLKRKMQKSPRWYVEDSTYVVDIQP